MSIPTESIGCASLGSVLWNLLANALNFTDESGRVHVLLERVTPHLEISVADTGQEITPEFLPFVLDRFRQADASSTRSHRGLARPRHRQNLIELRGDNGGQKA